MHGCRFFRLVSASVALAILAGGSAFAADVLFPTPLHLTRQIHDSISDTTATIDQYCYGNRVVFVSGSITTIADYEKGELTEIDRQERTYSITRFADVAKALSATAAPAATSAASSAAPQWKIRNGGVEKTRGNRTAEVFEGELEDGTTTRQMRVAVDRSIALSKDALDVLIGAAYPGKREAEDHVIVEAARARGVAEKSSAARYALPVEQHHGYVIDGSRAEVRDLVTRVGDELAPAEALAIPPGATLVESRMLIRTRMIEALDEKNLDALRKP